MKKYLFLFWGTLAATMNAQIGIGTTTPNSTAQFEISATDKGVLFPRMTNTQMIAISSPATGLQIFNTSANCMYYYNGSQWLSTLNSFKVYANAGTNVQFDNIICQIPTSGNRSLQIKTVSGSVNISGTSTNVYIITSAGTTGSSSYLSGFIRQSFSLTNSYAYWQSGADFPMHGSYQEVYLNDETNNRYYKILCIIGSGYSNNFFEIERQTKKPDQMTGPFKET